VSYAAVQVSTSWSFAFERRDLRLEKARTDANTVADAHGRVICTQRSRNTGIVRTATTKTLTNFSTAETAGME
jgi:hypothetical protein